MPTERHKYPRTYHMPWSDGVQNDDRVIQGHTFDGNAVVITTKMDGENTSVYPDLHIHARSIDTDGLHPSRKKVWSMLKARIADYNWVSNKLWGKRVCGENCYAKHSIEYDNLESHFYIFSIHEFDWTLPWIEVIQIAQELNYPTVPVLYIGEWDEEVAKNLFKEVCDSGGEGIVIRRAQAFHHTSDPENVSIAKAVRKGHVQPNAKHWATAEVIPNKLKTSND